MYQTTYSYFEEGCRITCTRQTRKVLWGCSLSSLFFKQIWKNGRRGHGHMSASAKGKEQKQVRQLCVTNSVLSISHITFRYWRVHILSDNLSRNSCICHRHKAPHRIMVRGFLQGFLLCVYIKHREGDVNWTPLKGWKSSQNKTRLTDIISWSQRVYLTESSL